MSITINLLEKKSVKERMWKSLNIVVAVATVLNISGAGIWFQPPVARAAAAPAANLDQCANGDIDDPAIPCAGSAWQNGNLNENQAHYFEGDSVPYRAKFSDLSIGSHTVTIEWDTTQGGKHALDYLTSYDRTETTADPCSGVAGCGSPSTFSIPTDPNVSGAGVTPIPGNFTLYNGTITAASAYTLSGSYAGNSSTRITLTFTTTVSDPVLAWGGHIATRTDWGQDQSAVTISGSPYHMRVFRPDASSGANQDRSLQSSAVVYPASITIIKQATPEGSQSFDYTSTGGLSPASFSLVDDGTSTNTKAFSNLTNFTTYTVSETVVAGWTLSFNTPVCTVTSANGGSQTVSSPTVSINLKEGENVTCTYKNERQAATVTVIKNVINDNGGTKVAADFAMHVTGANPSPANFPGNAVGTVVTITPGVQYTVSEDAVTGYAGSYSADCTGTVAAGQNKTCTVTNNDVQPKLTVTKVVINDNGGTKVISDFPLFVDATGVTSGAQNGFNAGTYTVSETNQVGYVGVISGDCASNGSVTLAVGDVKSCTITNNDQASTLIVKKVVVNDNGGNAVVTDFSFKVNNGSSIAFEGDAQNDLTVNAGTYSVVENAATGYATTYDNCSNVVIANGGTATCTITNNDVAPTITLNKVVINDNGGNAGVNDFGLTVGGNAVTSGQTVSVNANTPIALNEAGLTGYTFVSLTGDAKCPAVLNGTVSLNEGENITCTITNNDVAPTITLNKVVINDNGGNADVNDFGLTVGGNGVTSGQTVSVNSNSPIALNEAGLTGYTFVSLTGNAKCPAVLNGTVTLNEGENITCTITNNDVAPSITLNKVVINDNGGTAGVNAFGLTIGGTPVNSGDTSNVMSNTPILLNEAGLFGYSFVSITGDNACPSVLNGAATLNEGQHITCTITNNDIAPKLTVYKIVINDDGGTAVSSDFTMNVAATNASPSQFPGSDTGTLVTLNQGAYGVTENAFTGYTPAYSQDCTGSINVGQEKVCVVTNTDNTPHLIVVKHVINDNGGVSTAANFTMNVSGTDVSLASFPGNEAGTTVSLDTGAYNVTESGPAGYADSYSADCSGTIALGQTKICTITNNDIAPQLTVIKHVVNDNGGNNVAADFTMQVGGTNVSNPSFAGSEAGTTVTLNQGAYTVGEIGLPGYAGTMSADCVGTIAVGEHKTCTITNNDQTASITLNKVVINNNGGTAGVNDFGLTIGGTSVNSGDSLNVNANTPKTLNEAGPFGYAFVSITGDAKCPAVLNGTVTLNEGENVTCTITNDDIQPKLTVTKVVVNDDGGSAIVSDFDLFVNATQVTSDAQNGFNADAYVVSEDTNVNYTSAISGDCDANGNVSLAVGQVKACTITNNDIAADILVKKDGLSTVQAGDKITYTITWNVNAPGFAANAMLDDTLPTNVTYVSSTCGTTAGTCIKNDSVSGHVTWDLGTRTAPDSGTVTVTVQTNNPEVTGTLVHNVVEFTTDDDTSTDDQDTTILSDFTVGLVKTDNIDPVLAGGQVIYTLAWTTSGNAPISNLVITDPIPANMTFVSASNGGTLNGGIVTWNLGAHTPGDFGSVTLTLQAASPIANGTVVTNIGTVCGQMLTAQEQTVEHCTTDDETTTITSTPSISITKTNNIVGFTNPGKTVTYTVVVTNSASATDTAHAVNLTDLLPSGFTFVDGGLGTKTFALGDIAPGASVTTTYVVNISSAQVAGIYTNTASAQGSNTGKVSATSNVEVRVPQILGTSTSPELTITKKANPTSTNPGKLVSYTLVVKNIGDGDATNVVITDTLPAGFTYVDGGTQTKIWELGTLEANHERTINYQVRVGENVKAGKYTNTAVVTADGLSATAQATVTVKVPQVLGLATTGVSVRDYITFALGLSLIALGGLWIGRLRQRNGQYLNA